MDSNTCSMISCYNAISPLTYQQFYQFPKNFNLCMLWVQNCGRSELFEDFAYGGAQPFINKVICSDHFNNSDFNDPSCISKGLKPQAVPALNCNGSDFVVVKQEYEELDDTLIKNATEPMIDEFKGSIDNLSNLIKEESDEGTLHSANSSSEFAESQELVHDDLEPLLVVSKEKSNDGNITEYQKSQRAFRTAWKRALESAEERDARNRENALRNTLRRANETEEQRRTRNETNALRNACRRANESDDERKDRLYKNAVRAALRRSMESEVEQKERRRKNALRAAFRRSIENEKQRSERREKDKVRSAERRKTESEMQCRLRRYNDAVRAAFRRSNETDDQRQQRRMYDVMRAARRRSHENPEQRMKRLQSDRERATKRRMLKKLALSVANIQNTFFTHDLEPYLNNDSDSRSNSLKLISEPTMSDSFDENLSNDELSNQSECTYNEGENVRNTNLGKSSEKYNKCNRYTEIKHSNSANTFSNNIDITCLANQNVHNKHLEMNHSEMVEKQPTNNKVKASPEVVWCT